MLQRRNGKITFWKRENFLTWFLFFKLIFFAYRYQQILHRNLVYLATIADSNQNMQSLLPAVSTVPIWCQSLLSAVWWDLKKFVTFSVIVWHLFYKGKIQPNGNEWMYEWFPVWAGLELVRCFRNQRHDYGYQQHVKCISLPLACIHLRLGKGVSRKWDFISRETWHPKPLILENRYTLNLDNVLEFIWKSSGEWNRAEI